MRSLLTQRCGVLETWPQGNRCRHYTLSNDSGRARVSLDFRVIPAHLAAAPGEAHRSQFKLEDGGYYVRLQLSPPPALMPAVKQCQAAYQAASNGAPTAPDDGRAAVARARMAAAQPLAVLLETDELVCVSKPAWLLTHSSKACPGEQGLSAVDVLRAQLGRHVLPLHRLDRQTSGALLLAKSGAVAHAMQARWHAVGARKHYLVLVRGSPESEAWRSEYALKEATRFGKSCRRTASRGRPSDEVRLLPASTDFVVLARLPQCDATLLLATLASGGRTHQVRRHLFRCRLHVWGDTTYGPSARENAAFREAHGLRRMFLHACALMLPPSPPLPTERDDCNACAPAAIAQNGLHVVAPLAEELREVLMRLPGVPPAAVLAARLQAVAPDCAGALTTCADGRRDRSQQWRWMLAMVAIGGAVALRCSWSCRSWWRPGK